MNVQLLDVAAILVGLAALLGLVNHHLFRLPFTIGLTVSALAASGVVLALDALAPQMGLGDSVRAAVTSIDFHDALMNGMLSFLLFAGALHVNLEELLDKKGPILSLASVGLVISTLLVGFGSHWLFGLAGIPVSLPYCLVFGALIPPTDPIAVLGIMRSAGAPRGLEIKVAGESLFNDGFAVVTFAVLLKAARQSELHLPASEVVVVLLEEVGGGILLGLLGGYVTYRAMRTLDETNLEILLSVALVLALPFVATRIHASAPLACVVAGLLIGNQGRSLAMSERTRTALDVVWSFVDEALNAVLFLLIGLEVVAISFGAKHVATAVLLVPLALLARFISVLVPVSLLKLRTEFTPGAVTILTWGGLKGGISIALALSLPEFPGREAVLTATYAIVVFSIIVQGMTIGRVVRRVKREDPSLRADAPPPEPAAS